MMKIPCIVSMGLLLTAGVYAQGTIQYHNNGSSLVQVLPDGGGPAVPVPNNAGYEVELFYQPNNGGAAPAAINFSGELGNWNGVSVLPLAPTGDPPGIFVSGNTLTLSGVAAGANAWIDIVAWNQSAPSLAAALSGGSTLFASAPVFSVMTGNFSDAENPAPTAPTDINGPGLFQGFVINPAVPEPSNYALVGIGAAGLLLFRPRRKLG